MLCVLFIVGFEEIFFRRLVTTVSQQKIFRDDKSENLNLNWKSKKNERELSRMTGGQLKCDNRRKRKHCRLNI